MNVEKSEGPTLRSRQQKNWSPKSRPTKRLFTPEIKRHLKSWLVRRRENPYPNREEKTELADQTGLTYIQICNWFANWRRKLKNSGKNIDEYTWSTLIKGYNDQALGNVEHLSISSDDSIWEETKMDRPNCLESKVVHPIDHCYSSSLLRTSSKSSMNEKINNITVNPNHNFSNITSKSECLPQCFQVSSTTDFLTEPSRSPKKRERNTNFFKKTQVTISRRLKKENETNLKKTLRDKNWNYRRMMNALKNDNVGRNPNETGINYKSNIVFKKWRKSAALYRPDCKINPNSSLQKKVKKLHKQFDDYHHGREELDAAEALTFLSRASINK